MTDDLNILAGLPPDRPLDGLEAAVWNRVAAREAQARRLTPVASAQAVLFLAAVAGSAALGGLSASRAASHATELGVFSPHAALAPSSRLLDGRS